ncbi:hypothetical protein GCM10009554_10370 [Kribbella koreensis]|uniref:Uncharacterized protein n=1 Tax=Kribbella koreensis TaxID=57909 RepID=A0ABN1PI74_9ACTN
MLKTHSGHGSLGSQRCSAAAILFQQHGVGLLSLALVLTGDQRRAEESVSAVVCAAHPASLPHGLSATGIRQELAQRLYFHCDPRPSGPEQLEELALALTTWGRLNEHGVAFLLEVPAATVTQILSGKDSVESRNSSG